MTYLFSIVRIKKGKKYCAPEEAYGFVGLSVLYDIRDEVDNLIKEHKWEDVKDVVRKQIAFEQGN